MADQASRIQRRWMRVERVEIIGKAREAVVALIADQIERRRRRAIEGQRRERDAAVAGHDRGDALADFRAHIGGDEQRAIVMGVDIDESRRDDKPFRIEFAPAAASRQPSHCSDALAVDCDVGAEARGAAAVDHASAAQDQIMTCHCSLLARALPCIEKIAPLREQQCKKNNRDKRNEPGCFASGLAPRRRRTKMDVDVCQRFCAGAPVEGAGAGVVAGGAGIAGGTVRCAVVVGALPAVFEPLLP